MIKDFSISFSRVNIIQDSETVTFYVLFVYKPGLYANIIIFYYYIFYYYLIYIIIIICIQADLLCYFMLDEKAARFKSVQ